MQGLFGRFALLAAIAAALLVASAGPAYRYAGFDLLSAFGMLRYGLYAAAIAATFGILWIVFAFVGRSVEGLITLLAALVIAGIAAFIPLRMGMQAASLPPIHDVTTDTTNPPIFIAIAPLRANAENGIDYATDPTLQQNAYPDIQTFVSPKPPAELYKKALALAREMGWEIVSDAPDDGRIEATDTTLWFGFKEDIVIRVAAEGTGTRFDMRSMSRVGKSDFGDNAERIRAFMQKLKAA